MSGRPSSDYTYCPRCGHRTVLFYFGKGGEDYYRCSWRRRASCGWEELAEPGDWDTSGRIEMARWRELNDRRLPGRRK